MNATRTINFYGEEAQVIAEALARKDAEIESLRQQLVDYQTKHDVACLTINMLQEKCDIRGRALSLQCKETKELRQQLAAAQASPTIEACRQMIEAKAVKENQELHNKLAAALAAIKVKDAFIERVAKQTPEKPDYWTPCGQCEHNTSEAEDLLAIQPDDSALKAFMLSKGVSYE